MPSKKSREIGHATQYFPFAPGIPWRVENKTYILPKTSKITYDKVIEDKENLVVLCYGGLLESFLSLTIVEALNKQFPQKKLFWSGYDDFKDLIKIQGITQPINSIIDENKVKQYPIPIFFDKEDNVYFNALHNYLTKDPFVYTEEIRINKKPIVRQIFDNSLLRWDKRFLPKIRQLNLRKYDKWANLERFYNNQKYVLIFPNKTTFSAHNKISCLSWTDKQILRLAALVRHAGINLVVCSDLGTYSHYYNAPNIFVAKPDLSIIIKLYENASAVISRDIDYLFLGLALSENIAILGDYQLNKDILKYKEYFDLEENADYLGVRNLLYINDEFSVDEAATILETI